MGSPPDRPDKRRIHDCLLYTSCITLHIPNTPENYHFIDKAELDIMKDGVVIVNTARGPAWNLDAVYEAVKSGKVGAAGVDVYEQEPPEKDMPILQCPNAVSYTHLRKADQGRPSVCIHDHQRKRYRRIC